MVQINLLWIISDLNYLNNLFNRHWFFIRETCMKVRLRWGFKGLFPSHCRVLGGRAPAVWYLLLQISIFVCLWSTKESLKMNLKQERALAFDCSYCSGHLVHTHTHTYACMHACKHVHAHKCTGAFVLKTFTFDITQSDRLKYFLKYINQWPKHNIYCSFPH